MFTEKMDVVCSCLIRLFLGNHRKGQKRSAITANILLLQRSRNFSALLDDVEMFFTCAFAFLCWGIGSETKEYPKNLTFLIKNVWAVVLYSYGNI